MKREAGDRVEDFGAAGEVVVVDGGFEGVGFVSEVGLGFGTKPGGGDMGDGLGAGMKPTTCGRDEGLE